MNCQIVQESQVGNRRRNEDRVGHWSTGRAELMVVADGMGGHPHGDLAAEGALQTLSELFLLDAQPELPRPGAFLGSAFLETHRRLLAQARQWRLPKNHCTTLVACVVQKGLLWWAHCGDSRLYLVRGGELVVRTRDHSVSERRDSLVGKARLPAGVSEHVLVSCLGGTRRPMVDCAGPWSLADGDRLLLCSDGLWGPLTEPALLHCMRQGDMQSAVRTLVQDALTTADPVSDNVTALGCLCQSSPEAVADTVPAAVRALAPGRR